MSTTTGSYSVPMAPDMDKAVASFVIGIPAGAAVAQVANPGANVNAITVFNPTANLLRATVTFAAGITSGIAAGQRVFLIPSGATVSYDFGDGPNDSLVGSVDSIDSVSFIAVQSGAVTAEASTLVAATAAVAGVAFVNFGSA